jgi:hypothetical protein
VHRSPLTEIVPLFGADGGFVADAIVPIHTGPRASLVLWRGRYFHADAHGFYVECPPLHADNDVPMLHATA